MGKVLFGWASACLLMGCANAQSAPEARANPAEGLGHFSEYGSGISSSNKYRCVVGARADDDGMHQRPLAILYDGRRHALWNADLTIPDGFYQARATHCLVIDNAVYVLVQADTQSQQTLSQTQLIVDCLRMDTGRQQWSRTIPVPAAKGAYSAWVPAGLENFNDDHGHIRVQGVFRLLSSPDTQQPFQFSLPAP